MTQRILPGFEPFVGREPTEPPAPEVNPWRALAALLAIWNVRTAQFAEWVEHDSARLRAA